MLALQARLQYELHENASLKRILDEIKENVIHGSIRIDIYEEHYNINTEHNLNVLRDIGYEVVCYDDDGQYLYDLGYGEVLISWSECKND